MNNRESIKRIIKLSSIIIFIITLLSYSIFASFNLIKGPEIVIYEPMNGMNVSTSSINIKGKASRIKDIYLNGRPIVIDKDGNFNEIIVLHHGYNSSQLYANDKFKRTIEYKIELVYLD